MENYDENLWSNDILEDDDEQTIKLKQRLNRAESELEREREEQARRQERYRDKTNIFGRKRYRTEPKHSSLVVDPNAMGLERFGYDKQAHIDMKNGKGYTESFIENPKIRMAFYIGVSVLCVAFIIIEIFFL